MLADWFAGRALTLLSAIFLRVANPVEPFSFLSVQDALLSPLFHGLRDHLGQQENLPNQLDQRQPN
jgi:hypothetical protein